MNDEMLMISAKLELYIENKKINKTVMKLTGMCKLDFKINCAHTCIYKALLPTDHCH